MDYDQSFRTSQTLIERMNTSNDLMKKHPDRIAVIVEPHKNVTVEKKKFLVPKVITFGELVCHIRKRVKLNKEDALFFFIENEYIPRLSETLMNLYNEYKNEDGFLYVRCIKEQTYGQ